MQVPTGFDIKQAHVTQAWPHDRPLISCRFAPSGEYVFCGSEDAVVERFRLSDGNKTVLAGGHDTWVRAIAFAKDGSRVISGGCDGQITWWDTMAESPTPLMSKPAHQGWVRSLAVSPDGQWLASGGNDNKVRVWGVADGSLKFELAGHEKHVYCVAFHPSGEFLLGGDLGGKLTQWQVSDGAKVRDFDASPLYSYNGGQQVDFGGVRAIAVSPDGKWLAAGGLHKASNPLGAVHEPLVVLFEWETQAVKHQQIAEGITQGVIWRLQWLVDGTLVGVSGGASGGWLIFWNPESDKDVHRFALPNIARDMDVHPDGLRVATAHHDRHVRITELKA